ncbi:MAG: hypothetical protein AB8F26_07050 [Phycisphaerales bacterium]
MAQAARFIPENPILSPAMLAGLAIGLSSLAGASRAQAQVRIESDPSVEVQPERPSGAQRVVRRYDFEESGFNPLPIPVGWVRAQHDPSVPRIRPEFPIWNQATLDQTGPSVSGNTAVRMPIDGGSTSLRLLPGAIGVFPGTDYLVSAKIRTDGLVHARACVAARLLDQQGNVLPESESLSPTVRTMGEWTEVSAVIAGLDENAAYLQIELLVLQPKELPEADLDRAFAVWYEDYDANAWFDDVEVTLLPRIELDTGVPGHAIDPEEQPKITMLVRDLTGETLSGVLRVIDVDRRIVSEQTLRSSSGKLSETRVPTLPGPGWYRAMLDVSSVSGVVGRGVLDFVWGAAEDVRQNPDPMFTISADANDVIRADALPVMTDWSNASGASVGVWRESQVESTAVLDANPAYDAVRGLLNRGLEVAIRAGEVPGDLALLAGRDPWDVPGVFGSEESLWMPWIEGALDRFGQGVISWQLGDYSMYSDTELLDVQLDAAEAVFERWIPGPEIRSPWPIGESIGALLVQPGRGVVITDDGAGEDASIAERVAAWAAARTDENPSARGGLTIEFPAKGNTPAGYRDVGRLARRAMSAWVAAHNAGVADRVELALRDPWRSSGGRRPSMMPSPEVALWRTLASALGQRSGLTEVELLPGVRTIIIGNDEDALLVAWLTDPTAPSRIIELPLGDSADGGSVQRIGLMGDRTPIGPTEDPRWGSSVHRIELSRDPVLVDGVDAPYLTLLASVRLLPDRLEPVLGNRIHELEVFNPFAVPVRGKVFIVEPGGLSDGVAGRDRSWQISPRVVPFAAQPNETFRIPIDILFGAGQQTGLIPAVFDVQVSADKEYPTARVARWIPIESELIQIEATATRSGEDVVVRAFITNLGEESRAADLVVSSPGSARERSSVRGIAAGSTIERRFVIRGVPFGQAVLVSLIEPRTGERLLKSVRAE